VFTKRGNNEPPSEHIGPVKWSELPDETQEEMTMNGEMMFQDHYIDWEATSGGAGRVWTRDEMNSYLNPLKEGKCRGSYDESCDMIHKVFKKYSVVGKSVLVLGSQSPWIEAIAIFMNASEVHTVDFQKPDNQVKIPSFKILSFSEVQQQYDVVVSYSSLEHDGLGRYGDPIHPNGDILRMKALLTLIKPQGLFLLGVPIGPDSLCFNAHRIYGLKRMEKLTEGYERVDFVAGSKYPQSFEDSVKAAPLYSWSNQPIIVLRKP